MAFLGIYNLAILKDGSAADHLRRSDEGRAWDLHLGRPLNDWELTEVCSITSSLEGEVVGCGDEDDKWWWLPNGSEEYLVKSCFPSCLRALVNYRIK